CRGRSPGWRCRAPRGRPPRRPRRSSGRRPCAALAAARPALLSPRETYCHRLFSGNSLGAMWRQREFRRLWTATTIDAFGSWLLVMALPLHVFASTGSIGSTGLTLAVEAAPALLVGLWAGSLVDRWPRRRVLVLGNL